MRFTVLHGDLAAFRHLFRLAVPGLGSAHASEVVASGCGFRTHAAFGTAVAELSERLSFDFDVDRAVRRIEELSPSVDVGEAADRIRRLLSFHGCLLDAHANDGGRHAVLFDGFDRHVSAGGDLFDWASRVRPDVALRLATMLSKVRVDGRAHPASAMTAAAIDEACRRPAESAKGMAWFGTAWRFFGASVREAVSGSLAEGLLRPHRSERPHDDSVLAFMAGPPDAFVPAVPEEMLPAVVFGNAEDSRSIGLADHGWTARHSVPVLRAAAAGALLLACWQGLVLMRSGRAFGPTLAAVDEALRRSCDPLAVLGQFGTVDSSLEGLAVAPGGVRETPHAGVAALPWWIDGGCAIRFADASSADLWHDHLLRTFEFCRGASYMVRTPRQLGDVLGAVEVSDADCVRIHFVEPVELPKDGGRTFPEDVVLLLSGRSEGVLPLLARTHRREALLENGFSGPGILVQEPGRQG